MNKTALYTVWGVLQGIMLLVCLPAKGQVNSMRLTGESTYKRDIAGYILTDSTGYRYTGKHSSNMKTGVHKYDTAANYIDTGKGKEPGRQWLRTFDAADRIATHTAQQYAAGSWRNNIRYTYTYLPGGDYDSVLTERWDTTAKIWKHERLQQYKYKSGVLDSIIWWKPSGSNWVKEGRDVYIYNGANLEQHRLDIWNDTLTQWDIWQQDEYTYDVSGKKVLYISKTIDIPTLMPVNRTKTEYTWDGSGRMALLRSWYWFAAGVKWEGSYEHYYSYTSHNDVDLETVNVWDMTAQAWGPYSRRQHNYDAAFNLLDITEKQFVFPSYENVRKEEWLYKTYNLPTIYRSFLWDGTAWQQEQGNRTQVLYYYEGYDSTLSITANRMPANNMALYPNPARDAVTLQMNWDTPQPVYIMLYDIQGRMLQRWQVADARNCKQSIPLAGMASGLYILRATDGNKEMTKQLFIDNQ